MDDYMEKQQRVNRLFDLELSNRTDELLVQKDEDRLNSLRHKVEGLITPAEGPANWLALKSRIETQRASKVVVDHGLELLRTTFTRSHNKFEGSLTGVIAAFPRNSTTARKLGLKNDGEWTDVPPLENTLTFEDAIKAVNKKRTAERRDTSEESTDLSDMGEETQVHITRGGMQNTFPRASTGSFRSMSRQHDKPRDRSDAHILKKSARDGKRDSSQKSRSPRSTFDRLSLHRQSNWSSLASPTPFSRSFHKKPRLSTYERIGSQARRDSLERSLSPLRMDFDEHQPRPGHEGFGGHRDSLRRDRVLDRSRSPERDSSRYRSQFPGHKAFDARRPSNRRDESRDRSRSLGRHSSCYHSQSPGRKAFDARRPSIRRDESRDRSRSLGSSDFQDGNRSMRRGDRGQIRGNY